jgi:methylmalonyl-CoA mutase N-terminal domain/subunit
MLAAIEAGWVQRQIQDAAYEYQRSIESKDRTVVGVNAFRTEDETTIPIHTVDPALETAQVDQLRGIRKKRDEAGVRRSLQQLDAAARTAENLMPHILNAVEAYATIGEISDVFRNVHGEFREALAL